MEIILILINLSVIVPFLFFLIKIREVLTENEKLISYLKKSDEAYKNLLKEQDVCTEYAVKAVLKELLEKEDYENAKRCKDLLDTIEKRKAQK